jgi:hypothetical protein
MSSGPTVRRYMGGRHSQSAAASGTGVTTVLAGFVGFAGRAGGSAVLPSSSSRYASAIVSSWIAAYRSMRSPPLSLVAKSAHRPLSRLTLSEAPSPPLRSPQTHSWPLRLPPGSHWGTRVSLPRSRRCASALKSSFMRPPAVSARLRHCGKPRPRHPQHGSTQGIPPARGACGRCAT